MEARRLQNQALKQWATQIRAHNKAWPSPGTTGVIVAEWNASLKYYVTAFDHLGEVVDKHRVIFEYGAS